jgi:uncharacterized protein (UPF0276 family)
MRARPLRIGLNLFASEVYRAAAGPLFEAGLVDALEWDVDESWGSDVARRRALPPWVDQLLDVYSEDDALYGHGVWFSFLSARWEPRQERWLELLAQECRARRYRHFSEHFGFFTAGDFTRATMFPVPLTDASLRIGRDRLRRLALAAGVPVGLENTAIALNPDDATTQGAFLQQLLEPNDNFLLFDVHNVWTQCRNLGLSVDDILPRYPLDRVRELHISGGDWYQPIVHSHKGPMRLDSHDGPVPDDAFALLPSVLRRCPNAEVLFLEHRGANLDSDAITRYQADFKRLREIVESVDAEA